jgi:hypothetical protein
MISIMGPLVMMIFFPLSIWWCFRQYYCARAKGYYPASAALASFGIMLVVFIVENAGAVLLGSPTWPDVIINIFEVLLFPVAALVVAALVALLPRRPRRAGPRRSWFLSSSASRVSEIGIYGLFFAACACILAGRILFGYDSSAGSRVTQWEGILGKAGLLMALAFAALSFARKRLSAPSLADVVTTDTRPPVLYLRAFRQESEPFTYVPRKEIRRYTQREGTNKSAVTFEQYFGAVFIKQLGPFVALGNPLDSFPPEGAARSYAPDDDWQRHFFTHAAAATAIVINGSLSNNLYWELSEVARNGWQCKLFFFTCPALPHRGRPTLRIVEAIRRSTKGIRLAHWEQLTQGLKERGLYMPPADPGPGSVIAFDVAGRAEVLIREAQKSEEFVAAVRMRLQ